MGNMDIILDETANKFEYPAEGQDNCVLDMNDETSNLLLSHEKNGNSILDDDITTIQKSNDAGVREDQLFDKTKTSSQKSSASMRSKNNEANNRNNSYDRNDVVQNNLFRPSFLHIDSKKKDAETLIKEKSFVSANNSLSKQKEEHGWHILDELSSVQTRIWGTKNEQESNISLKTKSNNYESYYT